MYHSLSQSSHYFGCETSWVLVGKKKQGLHSNTVRIHVIMFPLCNATILVNTNSLLKVTGESINFTFPIVFDIITTLLGDGKYICRRVRSRNAVIPLPPTSFEIHTMNRAMA